MYFVLTLTDYCVPFFPQNKVLFIHSGVSFGRFVLFVTDGKHYVSALLEVNIYILLCILFFYCKDSFIINSEQYIMFSNLFVFFLQSVGIKQTNMCMSLS